MFINFRSAFEFLFKSFDISGDTKMIEKLESDGIRFLMIVKRHWLYAIVNSWRVIFVIIIAFINAYLLVFSEWTHTITSYIIAILLLANVWYWIIVVIVYIKHFYDIQWSKPYIEDIHSCIKKSKMSDSVFTTFFNQTIFLLFSLIWIAIFTWITSWISLLNGWDITFWVNITNTALLLFQIWLFYWYLNIMINTEMDYKIIVPGQILSFNQKWVFWDTQSMNSDKIKTMNTKYTWFISSFLNYWNVLVFSEWDQKNSWEMVIDYVWDPVKSVKEMEKVLRNDLAVMEKEVNVLLKKLESEIWIPNISTPENKQKLKEYVKNNEVKMKEIFKNADDETKNELRELYILIN